MIWGLLIIVLLVVFAFYLHNSGGKTDDFEHIRGTILTTDSEDLVEENTLILAGKQIPEEAVRRHILIGGTTGSGKSVATIDYIEGVLERVEREGKKAVITDSGGVFLSRFGKPWHDVQNPFDQRTLAWNPFKEIKNRRMDFDRIARSVVPETGSSDEAKWARYAKNIVADLMKSLDAEGIHNPVRMMDIIASADTATLGGYLKGTASEPFVTDANKEFFGSIQGVAIQYLRTWAFLEPDGSFSLRDWIREPGPGVLWMTYRDDMIESMRFLISSWVDMLITEILSMDESTVGTRFYFIMDELDSLGNIPTLINGLTRGRKYGLSIFSVVQSVAQLEHTYNEKISQTLRSCYASKLALAQGSAFDAEYWSREIGEAERVRAERSESENTGKSGKWSEESSNSAGTSESINYRRSVEKVVLPSELQRLKPMTGYLMLAGSPDIRYVEFPYRELTKINPPYIPKDFSAKPAPDDHDLFSTEGLEDLEVPEETQRQTEETVHAHKADPFDIY